MNNKIHTTFFCLIFLSISLHAQFQNRFSTGVRSGVSYTTISGIDDFIYPEDIWNRDAFTFQEKGRIGYVGSVFINYKSSDVLPILALQSELGFHMGGVTMEYRQPAGINNEGGEYPQLSYNMEFKYNYLDFATLVKVYPFAKTRNSNFGGLNVGVGQQISFNLSSDKIFYTSDFDYGESSDFVSDLNVQEELRLSLLGKTDVRALANIGYEFPMGLAIDARYGYGFVDALETIFNANNWINNQNSTQTFQFTVSYAIE